MIILAGITGWLLGWMVTLLSDFLPGWIQVPGATMAGYQPALLSAWQGKKSLPYMRLHLIAELLMSASVMVLAARSPAAWVWLSSVGAFLLLVALIDIKYRRVLNITIYPALVFVLFISLSGMPPTLVSHLSGGVLAFGLFWLVAVISPGGLGGGDIKLAGLLGCFFGLPGILWVLLAGTGAGAVAAVGLLAAGQGTRATRIPYAPFLCTGAVLVLLVMAV